MQHRARTVALAAGLIGLSVLLGACHKTQTGANAGAHGRRGGGDQPVPVSVLAAAKRDVPIWLDGLGTVQAYNTVTVRAQVTGQLVHVPLKEGDAVHAGELLAEIDPRSYQAALDQAIAKKAQDEAVLATARLDLRRYLDLLPQGYVTQQQVDQQKQAVAQDEAAVRADEAAIQADRVQLSYTRITSPIDGVLGIRLVDVGNLVSASDATGIVVVTQLTPISVVFTLPEQMLAEVRAAPQPVQVMAVDRDNQRALAQGELAVIDNQIDTSTGTIKLKAHFANADRALWPGQFVNVRLLAHTRHDGIVVPAQAVQRGSEGTYVYVVRDQAAQLQTVKLAQVDGGWALLDDGVQAGDAVIVDGQYRLQPGAKVTITGAAASGAPDAPDAPAPAGQAGAATPATAQ